MNIAHYFTFLRLVIIPFFPLFYLEYAWFGIRPVILPYILLVILVVCEGTDMMDGFLARKKNQVSDLGKVLDPMADSITKILVFFTFTQGWVQIPLILVFIFLYREFLISTLRTICALKGFALAARKSGKIKTALQALVNIVIVILLIPFTKGKITLATLQITSTVLVSLAALYSVLTAVDYIHANRQYIKKLFLSQR
jgi:CDP-diacylglycerol--glycerol-3-phosphate 3-phosphatidyltransferase